MILFSILLNTLLLFFKNYLRCFLPSINWFIYLVFRFFFKDFVYFRIILYVCNVAYTLGSSLNLSLTY